VFPQVVWRATTVALGLACICRDLHLTTIKRGRHARYRCVCLLRAGNPYTAIK